MSFQWLQMRIQEEQDRRQREAQILDRLPRVIDEVHRALVACGKTYSEAFGPESFEIDMHGQKISINIRDERNAKWEKTARVEVTILPKLPGLHIERNGETLDIEVGLLPAEKVSYKDGEEFLTMEEMTRRILDRSLFPKLGE